MTSSSPICAGGVGPSVRLDEPDDDVGAPFHRADDPR